MVKQRSLFRNRPKGFNRDLTINAEIKIVCESKFLGDIIDEKLSRKPYINDVKSEMPKSIVILCKDKYFLS